MPPGSSSTEAAAQGVNHALAVCSLWHPFRSPLASNPISSTITAALQGRRCRHRLGGDSPPPSARHAVEIARVAEVTDPIPRLCWFLAAATLTFSLFHIPRQRRRVRCKTSSTPCSGLVFYLDQGDRKCAAPAAVTAIGAVDAGATVPAAAWLVVAMSMRPCATVRLNALSHRRKRAYTPPVCQPQEIRSTVVTARPPSGGGATSPSAVPPPPSQTRLTPPLYVSHGAAVTAANAHGRRRRLPPQRSGGFMAVFENQHM